jgi:hypothetical protein
LCRGAPLKAGHQERELTEGKEAIAREIAERREGFNLVRGRRRPFTEDQERVIADAVVAYLEKNNWRIEQGPPIESASD